MDKRFVKTSNGAWQLYNLFAEWNVSSPEVITYTIQDYDTEYPSLYKLYMDMEDVMEWNFANKYLACWDQWQQLCEMPKFKPVVERWRKELSLKIQSQALKAIANEALSESRNAYAANKFLVERGWIEKEGSSRGRGRPSKKEIEEAARLELDQKSQILQDYERLFKQEELN